MASLLHTKYSFSFDKLQVLLGGWHAWDSAGYPSVKQTPVPAAPGAVDTTPAGNTIPITIVVSTPAP